VRTVDARVGTSTELMLKLAPNKPSNKPLERPLSWPLFLGQSLSSVELSATAVTAESRRSETKQYWEAGALEEVVCLAAMELGVPGEASGVKAVLYEMILYGEGAMFKERCKSVS
jgi:hypothetical protein